MGWPQLVGSGVPPSEMSDGMALRGKYQIWMLPWFQKVAYTPPPALLKSVPYELAVLLETPHPVLR